MKTVLNVTPSEDTEYKMSDLQLAIVKRYIQQHYILVGTKIDIKDVLEILPKFVTKGIKSKTIPKDNKIQGMKATYFVIDDCF